MAPDQAARLEQQVKDLRARVDELLALQEQTDELLRRALALLTSDDHPLAIKDGQTMVTAEQLAHRFSYKDAETIRKRATQFGGARAGDGPGAELRFDFRKADAYWLEQQERLLAEARPPEVPARAPKRLKSPQPFRHRRTGQALVQF
jgi:hypothetical protein